MDRTDRSDWLRCHEGAGTWMIRLFVVGRSEEMSIVVAAGELFLLK